MDQLIIERERLIGRAALKRLVDVDGGPVALRTDVKIVGLAEHVAVVVTRRQIPVHFWQNLEHEAVVTADVFICARFGGHRVEKRSEDVRIHVSDQEHARVVAIRVHLGRRVQLTDVVAVLACLEDKLRDSDANVRRHHHPKVSILLVVDQRRPKRGVRQVVDHLSDLVHLDSLAEHVGDLLLAKSVSGCLAHGVLKGCPQENPVTPRQRLPRSRPKCLDEVLTVSDRLDEVLVDLCDRICHSV